MGFKYKGVTEQNKEERNNEAKESNEEEEEKRRVDTRGNGKGLKRNEETRKQRR